MHKKEIRELICSMLLGDGCLYEGDQKSGSGNTTTKRYLYAMNHGMDQKDYALWKAELINDIFRKKNLSNRCTFSKSVKRDKKRNKTYYGIYVKLSWTKYFRHLMKRTHKFIKGERRKNVQYLLSQCTKPIHLAILMMDDGAQQGSPGSPIMKICTYSFTKGENQLIKEWLLHRYGIDSQITYEPERIYPYQVQKERYSVSINTKNSEKLFYLCEPYFSQIDFMQYKFRYFFSKYSAQQAVPNSSGTGDTVQTTTQNVA